LVVRILAADELMDRTKEKFQEGKKKLAKARANRDKVRNAY